MTESAVVGNPIGCPTLAVDHLTGDARWQGRHSIGGRRLVDQNFILSLASFTLARHTFYLTNSMSATRPKRQV